MIKWILAIGACLTLACAKPVTTDTITLKSGATLSVLHESGKARPAILYIPGGGYQGVSVSEGFFEIDWLRTNGVKLFTLHYKLGKYPTSYNDASNAWVYLNQHAAELGVDRARIALAGASAGGHLALLTALKTDIKPAAMLLVYPIVSMQKAVVISCALNLNEGNPTVPLSVLSENSAENYFNDTNLPPTFITQNSYDNVVPLLHSFLLVDRLFKNRQMFDYHVYQDVWHGMPNPPPWIDPCIVFMRKINFIKTK